MTVALANTDSPLNQKLQSIGQSAWQLRIVLMISGAIYPLGFAPFEFWPAAFISLFPLIYFACFGKALSAFKCGFYWGVGAFAVGASWVYVSIHEFGYVPVIGAALMTCLFVVYLALFKGLFAYLVSRLDALTKHHLLILIVPTCWVASEYLQSVAFGGFPWLLAGYSQIDSPLSLLATWLGVYGVSWMVVALVTAVMILGFNFRNVIYRNVLLMLIGLNLVAYVTQPPNSDYAQEKLDIALVQPNTAQEQKWDRRYFAQIIDTLMSESSDLWGADFVIWPEGAIPAYEHQVRDIIADLDKINQQKDGHLIVGIPEYETQTQRSFVSLFAIGEQSQRYHKQVLVPFGEYVPLQDILRGLIKFLDLPMSGFSKGSAEQLPMEFDQVSMIPAICYEIVYPSIIHHLATSGPQDKPKMIVTVSNDAWFGDSFGPYQHMEMARMRALELGIPLVRGTNDGITGFVDSQGRVLQKLPRYQQAHLRTNLSLEQRSTVYRKIGGWGILTVMILSSIFILWSIRAKHDTKEND